MGITYYEAKRLQEACLSGVSFQHLLSVGRLALFLHPAELESLRARNRSALANYQFGEYADRFYRELLGSETVTSIDYSDYEGATITHDMNQPVPDNLRGRFDVVIEGGSLEHIFNFPVAITNLMQMTKVGGVVFMTTVANNLCGHGFYQFSPELMYRVFSPENGFEATRVVFLEATFPGVELTPIRSVYGVVDPATAGSRVGLRSTRPIMMVVESKKVAEKQPFTSVPLQSDYVTAWNRGSDQEEGLLRRLFNKLPSSLKMRMTGYRQNRRFSLNNRRFYRKLP